MKDKRISIIVPIYNAEKHLRQCIESICNQTYKYLDIVLVDDGSMDASGSICDFYAEKDNRIKVIHQENQGSLKARYRGLAAADSKYVAFVDSDDWIEEKMFSQLMPIMLNNQIDLLIANAIGWRDHEDYSHFFGKELKTGFYSKRAVETLLIPEMLWSDSIHGWKVNPSMYAKIFNTELLKRIYADVKDFSFFYADDVAVCYPYILSCNSLYVVRESYYFYRLRRKGEIPPYYLRSSYFDDLYEAYHYLRTVFGHSAHSEVLIRQLEHYYIWSVDNRKRKYKEWDGGGKQYLFPFDKVEKGRRIVLYGAGNVGHQYLWQIRQTSFCNIVMWVDKNARQYREEGVRDVSEIAYAEFDYIVIALAGEDNIINVKKKLYELKVEEEKIIC